ncbi:MAG: hypothetical protein ACRDHW_20085 [Ktedonobacteraceae bacterium]
MAQELVLPYSFQSPTLPSEHVGEWNRPASDSCGVVITFQPQQMDFLTSKIETWFEDRDEVLWVESGVSQKAEQGYIILEWEGREIDPLFLAILRDDENIMDYLLYDREKEA